jgi:Homeodomain-like domain-containing protein/integrase-like protein
MPATRMTTVQQRQEMAHLAAAGQPYQVIADQIGVSFWTARKWIRRANQGGLAALLTHCGPPTRGPMATFDPLVRYVALRLKRQHLTWGAAYVLKKMTEHPSLHGKKLPDATTIWRYWRSFGERLRKKRRPADPKLPAAGVAHGVWQLDAKESVPVPGVGVTTFNQARDEFGRVTVMHRIHPAEAPEQRIVKLSAAQVQQDCRIAFTQWGLPDAIQTDRAAIFVDADPCPFPTPLTLWWVGLGIEHRLIPRHTPKRNGSVERSHRTLNERSLVGQHFSGAADLQQQVDADWHELNAECPSRARGCQGQPPLLAHPELLMARRPYRPEWELELFVLQRVHSYLAAQTWTRTVSQNGQVSLGGAVYGLGCAWAEQTVAVSFDAGRGQFVFSQVRPESIAGRRLPALAAVQRDAKGLSVADLTGLPAALSGLPPRQLMFPLSMCDPEPTRQAA